LNASETEIVEIVGSPITEPLTRLDGVALGRGVPQQLVKSAQYDDWIDEDDEDLRIIDLGEVFFMGSAPQKLPQPGDLQAPETIFLGKFGHEVDLWRIGLIVSFLMIHITSKCLGVCILDLLSHFWIVTISMDWCS
jgi:serine/threonine-protein kinase SRPK3